MRPHRRLIAAALAAPLFVVLPRGAGAQDVQWQSQWALALQATDNVLFTPMNGPASAVCDDGNPANDGGNCPVFGFIGNVNPQVQVSYETPRWLHALAYNFNFAWLLGGQDQFNFEHGLEARTRYLVSEYTTANFALRGAVGRQTFFPQNQPGIAQGQAAGFQPQAQEFDYVNVEAQQGIARQLREETAFTERFGVQLFVPIQDLAIDRDQPQVAPRPGLLNANVNLAVTHTDAPDEYSVTLASQLAAFQIYCRVPADCGNAEEFACVENRCVIREDELAAPRRDELLAITTSPQLLTRLGGDWRRDWQNGFTTALDVGVQHVMRLLDAGGQNVQPVGGVRIAYDREEAQVGLNYNHGAQINAAVAGIVMADNVELTAAIPLDRQTRNVVLQLMTGYQHGTNISDLGDALPGFDLISADAAIEYRPQRWIPSGTVGLRYQFRYQITDPQANQEPGALDPEPLRAMRNALILTLGYTFPDRGPAQ